MRKYFIIACLIALVTFTGSAKTTNFKTGVINTLHTDEFMEIFSDGNSLNMPVVIDVSAEWCGWCKKMHPHLEQLAKKYKGQIYFFQINYETDLDLISNLGINSYPTLIYIRPDATVVVDEDGFRTADQLDITLQEVFFGEDQSSVDPSWPTESWPGAEVASWPTESWPGTEVASWPTESWPETSWPMI